MDIQSAQTQSAAQFAVQALVLGQMKSQGADIVALVSSGAAPAGSFNLPGQGLNIDARA